MKQIPSRLPVAKVMPSGPNNSNIPIQKRLLYYTPPSGFSPARVHSRFIINTSLCIRQELNVNVVLWNMSINH